MEVIKKETFVNVARSKVISIWMIKCKKIIMNEINYKNKL